MTQAAPAIEQLNALAKSYRAAHPEISEASAFTAVYTAPENVNLRNAERDARHAARKSVEEPGKNQDFQAYVGNKVTADSYSGHPETRPSHGLDWISPEDADKKLEALFNDIRAKVPAVSAIDIKRYLFADRSKPASTSGATQARAAAQGITKGAASDRVARLVHHLMVTSGKKDMTEADARSRVLAANPALKTACDQEDDDTASAKT